MMPIGAQSPNGDHGGVAVLRLGSAVAVLQSGVGGHRADHDRVAAALLRAVTARSDIVVARRASGRPRLESPYPELAVSMSWRDGLLLVGFDPGRAVGVDIESADPSGKLEPHRLARDHYAVAEAHAVRALKDDAARELFLRLWVAKEAVLKLTGRGVHDGLSEPDLSSHIDALRHDGAVIALSAVGRLPGADVVVCRPRMPGLAEPPYCALARAR